MSFILKNLSNYGRRHSKLFIPTVMFRGTPCTIFIHVYSFHIPYLSMYIVFIYHIISMYIVFIYHIISMYIWQVQQKQLANHKTNYYRRVITAQKCFELLEYNQKDQTNIKTRVATRSQSRKESRKNFYFSSIKSVVDFLKY